ncbi:MAG: hypothetical protein IJF92_04005 [Bacilli bacterium]|nr:hypothetical protein [Bacilli bacterium]
MKAASGELNLTVITIIAVGAVSLFFLNTFWPAIRNTLNNQWTNISTKKSDDS